VEDVERRIKPFGSEEKNDRAKASFWIGYAGGEVMNS
jgi:hypothetical protein